MKLIGLGISILLFAILFQLCSFGLEYVALLTGIAGLICVINGCRE